MSGYLSGLSKPPPRGFLIGSGALKTPSVNQSQQGLQNRRVKNLKSATLSHLPDRKQASAHTRKGITLHSPPAFSCVCVCASEGFCSRHHIHIQMMMS